MGAKLDQSEDSAPLSEINVTPFVDVVLVLLVIFMVTAPTLLKDAVGIRLPKATLAGGSPSGSLGVAITAGGQVLLDGEPVTLEALRSRASELKKTKEDAQALLSADRDAKHGDVMGAIDAIRMGGIERFAIQVNRDGD